MLTRSQYVYIFLFWLGIFLVNFLIFRKYYKLIDQDHVIPRCVLTYLRENSSMLVDVIILVVCVMVLLTSCSSSPFHSIWLVEMWFHKTSLKILQNDYENHFFLIKYNFLSITMVFHKHYEVLARESILWC